MTARLLSRRRFIGIAGAAAGLALLPGSGRAAVKTVQWSGVALGARASIRLVHRDAAEARRVIALAVAEIERLEAVFSLYRRDSAVSRLNRDGRLLAPPPELVDLLARARAVSEASGGAFDVTVQPLWRRLAEHFAAQPAAEALPPLDDVLPLVDWRAVAVDGARLAFARPGMAVTPNGIAQGYITDRVAELLRRNGIEHVALDLGEARALGQAEDGRPWTVGIADPAAPERLAGRLEAADRAVATSGGYGTVFDREGRFSHLVDPRSGTTAPVRRGVTVVAGEACLADAWSTAFMLMEPAAIRATAARLGLEVYAAGGAGGLERLA